MEHLLGQKAQRVCLVIVLILEPHSYKMPQVVEWHYLGRRDQSDGAEHNKQPKPRAFG
jgi:hypothetical protein